MALRALLKGLTQEPGSQCLTPLNRKPGKFLLQVRNHWAFVQESPVITAGALEALCRVEKPGVSEETPGPVQASVTGGREVRAEGRVGHWKEPQLQDLGLQALGGRDRKVPEL